jgi:hypothetical protein
LWFSKEEREMWSLETTATKRLMLAAASLVAIACVSPAHADENDAKSLLKAMSDYLGAQKSLSFDFDSSLEVVTADKQRLALASSGSVDMSRPDKIRASRTGGFADVEMLFDGKTLTLLAKNLNAYAQAEVPGTVDYLVDELRDKFNKPLPAADLLMADPYSQLMPLVTNAKDLGNGVIRGQECDHLAFRTEDVDWQIWIAQAPTPYPCRYVITSTKVGGGPQYTIDVRNWKASTEAAAGDFSFKAPEGAALVKRDELADIDDLPAMFVPKR